VASRSTVVVSLGATAVGLLVGALLGLFVGTGRPAALSAPTTTSTSTTTTTTTTPPDPPTTASADAQVVSFNVAPSAPQCTRTQLRTRVVLSWATRDAQSVSIDADGSTVVDAGNPNGTLPMTFSCPVITSEQHTLHLTAQGANGSTDTSDTAVTVTGSLSTPRTTRDRGNGFGGGD
jgi:hypothetical protein